MSVFNVRQHDVGVVLTKTLEDEDGPVDLTGATVRFHMKPVPEADTDLPLVDHAAAVVSPATAGTATFTSTASDFDVVGVYDAEWEVTSAGGAVRTFPIDGYDTVIVRTDLA